MNLNANLPGRPITKTPPINIPHTTETTFGYDVSVDFFDPAKKSPPNSWTNRLISRFDQFSNVGSYLGTSIGSNT